MKKFTLEELAEHLISFGKKNSADQIEISIVDGHEFGVDIRFGEIENLVEAGSRYLGLKVIKDKKTAYATSSDLSLETLQHLMKNAVKRAFLANPDEYAGLAPLSSKRVAARTLDLFDPEIPELSSEKKINMALKTEKIGLDKPDHLKCNPRSIG